VVIVLTLVVLSARSVTFFRVQDRPGKNARPHQKASGPLRCSGEGPPSR